MNDNQTLAALAFFRATYDNNTDILKVLSEFIKFILSKNTIIANFTLDEIKSLLNSEFNFIIPKTVISTALKKLVRQGLITPISRECFEVTKPTEIIQNELIKMFNSKLDYFNNIINAQLIEYLKEKNRDDLIQNISEKFLNYLSNGLVNEVFDAFVIKHSENEQFCDAINAVKEGAIIQAALRYEYVNEINSFKNPLKIYLDTEIIFSWFGLNGLEFQSVIQELIELINEANKKKHNSITLHYFDETHKEIDNFFQAAETLLSIGKKPEYKKTAMKNIVNGCSSKSDILEKN